MTRPRLAAGAAATVSLLLGFGAMATLSATGRWTVGHSMWHYRAATWGDVVLVPGICAVVAAGLCDPLIPATRREAAWAAVGGFAFGLVGALVQVSWLASVDPVVNWTLPAPHTFSFPGWYHAGYLVVVATTIGAGGTVLARRVQRASPELRDRVSRLWPTTALCGFGISFGLVLWLDSLDSLRTSAGAGSALGAVAAGAFTLIVACVVLGPRRALRPLAGGAIFSLLLFAGTLLTQGFPA
jgi:hypothetical protein